MQTVLNLKKKKKNCSEALRGQGVTLGVKQNVKGLQLDDILLLSCHCSGVFNGLYQKSRVCLVQDQAKLSENASDERRHP